MKKKEKKILFITLSVIFTTYLLLVYGGPTKLDDHFISFLKKKDIVAVLIGSLISNIFSKNINAIADSFILPIISVFLNIDLSKSIKINGIEFNTKKIISSFINLVVSVMFIIIVFSKFETNNLTR
jgi:large-conductance mechanosensitive channel